EPAREALSVLGRRPRAQDVHESAGKKRADDLAEPVLTGTRHGLGLERGLLTQDRRVELLKRRRWLDPELLHEHPARVLVGLERLRLPPASIERKHQLAARALTQRVLANDLLEFAHERRRATALGLRLDPLLDRGQAKFLEPCRLVLRERLIWKIGERRPAPEAQGVGHTARTTL